MSQQLQFEQSNTLSLLATDRQLSVVRAHEAGHSYSPYGSAPEQPGALHSLGFTGVRREVNTGHYLLGNGYRGYNPQLMRFNSPDSWSPFGRGGINTYAYCLDDPINAADPSGHLRRVSPWGAARRLFKTKLLGRHLLKPYSLRLLALDSLVRQGRLTFSERRQFFRGDISGAGWISKRVSERPLRPASDGPSLYEPALRLRATGHLDASNMSRLYPAELGLYVKAVPGARDAIYKYSKSQAMLYLRTVHASPGEYSPGLLQGMLPEHFKAASQSLSADDGTMDTGRVLQDFKQRIRQSND